MKKLINGLIIAFLIFLTTPANAITVDKNYEYVTWRPGEENPKLKFVFSNPSNESVNILFSPDDRWIKITTNRITIENNSNYTIEVTLDPSNLSPGLYHGSFKWFAYSVKEGLPDLENFGTIYIDLEIGKPNTTCKLIPMVTDYITKIHKSAPSFTKTFSVMVSKDCPGPVNIQRPITVGTVQTAEGEKPISITGQLSLGWKEPGESATFDVEFNVKGMQPQTVNPKIIIYGIDQNGNRIETWINFEITIIGGEEIPPEINITTLPDWEFPNTVTVNEQFIIRARNVNPNLQPFIFPNEKLIGKGVDISGNTYEFRFVANETGKIKIKYTVMYKGAQIGPVLEKTITVTGAGFQQASTEMKLDFFPSINEWEPGMKVSVLCRDAGNNNIIPCTIYINGEKINENKFTVPGPGEKIFISAVNPSYKTKDFNYTVPRPKLKIVIHPNNPEAGDSVSIFCKDEKTNEDLECDIFVNGEKVKDKYIFITPGKYTITAEKEGYEKANLTLNVSVPPALVFAPEKLDKNQNITIKFNKEVKYEIVRETEEDIETIASGKGDKVSFVPKEDGVYKVIANGKLLKVYEIKGFSLPEINPYDLLLLIGIIALIFAIFKRSRRGFGRIRGYSSTGSGGIKSPLTVEEG